MKRLDWVGQKINELTILGYSHSHVQPSGQKRAFWDVKCSCGVVKKMSTSTLTNGATVSCGCVGREKRAKSRRKPPGVAAKNSLYVSYKHSAKNRAISFNLTKEQFYSVAMGECVYCGRLNPQNHKGKYKYGIDYCGVDRIDSSFGYEEGNVVTCCGDCNKMKNAHSLKFFLDHIERIYKNAIEERQQQENYSGEYPQRNQSR